MGTVEILEHLKKIRERIDSGKRQKAQIEGKLDSAYERLAKEFDVKDEAEALEEIKRLQEREDELQTKLTEDYRTLCEEYDL